MAGVPTSTYNLCGEGLLMTLSQLPSDAAVMDAVVADGLAEFEAHLGLRESPESHRLHVAAAIRASVLSP